MLGTHMCDTKVFADHPKHADPPQLEDGTEAVKECGA